jgi:hypothetical protein
VRTWLSSTTAGWSGRCGRRAVLLASNNDDDDTRHEQDQPEDPDPGSLFHHPPRKPRSRQDCQFGRQPCAHAPIAGTARSHGNACPSVSQLECASVAVRPVSDPVTSMGPLQAKDRPTPIQTPTGTPLQRPSQRARTVLVDPRPFRLPTTGRARGLPCGHHSDRRHRPSR